MKPLSKITALFLTTASLSLISSLHADDKDGDKAGAGGAKLPKDEIESIVGVEGDIQNGVLELDIERKDIPSVAGPNGTGMTFTPSFELNGDAFFQPLSKDRAFLNGDLCLKEEEVNPFIATLIQNGLVFQAFHQHLPMHPQLWFVHYRGVGDPLALAHALRRAINVTSTPLPQTMPSNPTSPLDAKRLGQILDGDASIGDDGVVTVWVLRKHPVTIDGVHVNPQANVSTNIEFRPIGGSRAQVVPDFSMTSDEVQPVVHLMLNQLGWYQGCLYNQETDEQPQLFFDHMAKTGDAYQLAEEIRRGLDLTDAEGSDHKSTKHD